MAQNIVKCSYCGTGVLKVDAQRHKNKNYHADCLEIQLSKEELTDYICKAENEGILNSFLDKYPHYTYKGIKQALVYFYEVQKKPIDKANQGIGIVPYVYDSAQEYYNSITMRQERVATALSSSLSIESQEIVVKKQEKKKKTLYDIETL